MKVKKNQLPARGTLSSQNWWNKFWALSNSNFGEPREEFIEIIKNFAGQSNKSPRETSVVDIGSGDGRYAIPFAKLGFKVTAIEFAENGAKKIIESAKKEGLSIKVIQNDFLKITPVPQDIVFVSGFIEELGSKDKQLEALRLMQKWTKPKGLLICRYCIEISGRGILINPEDLVIKSFSTSDWEILSSHADSKLRTSIANMSFENRLRTGTLVAKKNKT